MVTSFFMLRGEFHGRHFDREDEGKSVILTPTIDTNFFPGDCSSISDDRDNVHWYTALSESAFSFDIGVMDVHSKPDTRTTRVHLDLRGGGGRDGRIVAKRVSHDECYAIYG